MTIVKGAAKNGSRDPLAEVLSRIENITTGNDVQYGGRCPSHPDDRNSLCIGTGDDGKVLLKCQAGCNNNDIVNALGLE
jgi:putative DNA primase/helicase